MKYPEKHGLILLYTGDGRGKTTAALGTALRACGHGMRVAMVQFIKQPKIYGELKAVKFFEPGQLPLFEIFSMGQGCTWEEPDQDVQREAARQAWTVCQEKVVSNLYDLVIWDEIHCALDYGFLPLTPVLQFLQNLRPPNVHILLTGRHADPALIDLADMVSEVQEVKHHYGKGVQGQYGIEF